MSDNATAIVIHAAKDLRIEACPVDDPGKGEVLIDMEAGGICGSDLHYYSHGGFGAIRLKEPMVLGHEVAGRIAARRDAMVIPLHAGLRPDFPPRPRGRQYARRPHDPAPSALSAGSR
ncbi:MAG: alcohol dehydrogenase catalytic domain-containing protein, partial [Pseudomonadota bacterium]